MKITSCNYIILAYVLPYAFAIVSDIVAHSLMQSLSHIRDTGHRKNEYIDVEKQVSAKQDL